MGDNTDIIIMTEALKLVRKKLVNVMAELAEFADKYKNLPTLGIYPFPAGSADDGGKTGNAVAAWI